MDRRNWLKATAALAAGWAASPVDARALAAMPVSEAEREFASSKILTGKVFLNSNENPYGPPEKARQAVIQNLVEANRYPLDQMDELKVLVAKKEGVSVDHLHFGAGSGDILCQTASAFAWKGGSIMSAYPTFSLMMNYGRLYGSNWDRVDLNERLEHNYDAMEARIQPNTRLVFICNPNNPTGTLVEPVRVRNFCERVSDRVPVYADEAYLEFLEPSQQVSMVDLVRKGKNVIVSRTFSKIYGMAGMRIGYIVARPDIIKRIASFEHDIPVTSGAIAAAKAVIGNESFMAMTRKKTREARLILENYLKGKGIEYAQSHTNFLFFPAPRTGSYLLSELATKGFLIRIWEYQQKEWCRVSIGTQEEMGAFVEAFDEVLSKP